MQTVVLTIHILLTLGITILVLLQRPEGGALSALGGGQGASGLFTGRQAGNFLSRMTAYLCIGFIITSLTLVLMAKQSLEVEKVSIVPTEQTQETVVEAPAQEEAQTQTPAQEEAQTQTPAQEETQTQAPTQEEAQTQTPAQETPAE